MTKADWDWIVRERINLSTAPVDDWKAVYHWLKDEWHGEVVVKINTDDLEFRAYLVEPIEEVGE